jgi:hypothetical protein
MISTPILYHNPRYDDQKNGLPYPMNTVVEFNSKTVMLGTAIPLGWILKKPTDSFPGPLHLELT